jgi:cephalosporin-C deacetylase
MLIDLTVPELVKWQGLNPKPADHNAYWDRALKELDTVNPEPEFKPAKFSAPFAD